MHAHIIKIFLWNMNRCIIYMNDLHSLDCIIDYWTKSGSLVEFIIIFAVFSCSDVIFLQTSVDGWSIVYSTVVTG